ncbi:DUF4240 domain-containing protein [Streptacidiphilus melanogenes]|uniref:DUF4240 domain-containing protein n=1 Tax=Streptacidiphilus melanogenes TaxID=411235 RepID=UPI0005A7E2FD|nr:DUF4240 domain-containing protein [Streptacidiphilus melanogenes]
MDTTEFWRIIDSARGRAGEGLAFAEALVEVLAARPPREILQYHERFEEFHAALYRWDLWAAGYLIGGGCSDDGFIDFRAGVIALGQAWYERAAAAPDSLAEHPEVSAAAVADDDAVFDELVNYAAAYAFERLTGDEDDFYEAWDAYAAERSAVPASAADVAEDMGERFSFDDAELHRRLPHLAALFLGDLAR